MMVEERNDAIIFVREFQNEILNSSNVCDIEITSYLTEEQIQEEMLKLLKVGNVSATDEYKLSKL